jgi:hypothetical protein
MVQSPFGGPDDLGMTGRPKIIVHTEHDHLRPRNKRATSCWALKAAALRYRNHEPYTVTTARYVGGLNRDCQ